MYRNVYIYIYYGGHGEFHVKVLMKTPGLYLVPELRNFKYIYIYIQKNLNKPIFQFQVQFYQLYSDNVSDKPSSGPIYNKKVIWK